MEKTITYLGIEKVNYEFTEAEILLALREKYKIKASYDYEFNLCEGDEECPPYAELIIKYLREVDNDKKA